MSCQKDTTVLVDVGRGGGLGGSGIVSASHEWTVVVVAVALTVATNLANSKTAKHSCKYGTVRPLAPAEGAAEEEP